MRRFERLAAARAHLEVGSPAIQNVDSALERLSIRLARREEPKNFAGFWVCVAIAIVLVLPLGMLASVVWHVANGTFVSPEFPEDVRKDTLTTLIAVPIAAVVMGIYYVLRSFWRARRGGSGSD